MEKIWLFTLFAKNNGDSLQFKVHLGDTPNITLWHSESYVGSYHPEQMVYTGATVGGIHMGGVHKEEAYVSAKGTFDGKGYITFSNISYPKLEIEKIVLSERLLAEAKSLPLLKELLEGDALYLKEPFTQKHMNAVAANLSGMFSQVNLANVSTGRRRSYEACKCAYKLLKSALKGELHPEGTDIIDEMKRQKKKENLGCFRMVAAVVAIICGLIQLVYYLKS